MAAERAEGAERDGGPSPARPFRPRAAGPSRVTGHRLGDLGAFSGSPLARSPLRRSFVLPLSTRKGPITKTGTFVWPNPLLYAGFVGVVVIGAELERLARVRSQRFGITNRRAIYLGPRGNVIALDRPRIVTVEIDRSDLVIRGKGLTLTFNGLLDPAAARSALVSEG